MALTKLELEHLELIAEKLAYAVTDKVLIQHIKSCPHGLKLKLSKAYIVGIFIGLSVVTTISAGGGFMIARVLMGLP